MRLPIDLHLGNYVKPRIFLCDTSKKKICMLETTNTKASLKFNAYSELSFEVGRTYNDSITGENHINQYYDLIESPRIIYLEDIGHFEIQGPELSSDGIKESKTVTAFGLEYSLAQKYLTNFIINTGEIGSIEVTYAESHGMDMPTPVVLYDETNKDLSLLHLIFKKIYGWEIAYVDPSLCKLSREFEIERESVYDFLMNEVCKKFKCYVVFDTISDESINKIYVYAEPRVQKFVGNGSSTDFTITPPMVALGTVVVNNVVNKEYAYDPTSGIITFDRPPIKNSIIEINDYASTRWDTDVFVTFQNLSQEINVNYDADSIKTVLTVKGADDLDILDVNMGLPYIVDLSYYCSPKWLGQDLYDAYMNYLDDYNENQDTYERNSQLINEIYNKKLHEENRMSIDNIDVVRLQKDVTSSTYGKYFIREGTYPNYYYKEVSLPDDYNAEQKYYLFENEGVNLTESDVDYLYHALQAYFKSYFNDKAVDMKLLDECAQHFVFAKDEFDDMCNVLRNIQTYVDAQDVVKNDVESTNNSQFIFACVNKLLDATWNQLGLYPLKYCYQSTYSKLQSTSVEAGWGQVNSEEYGSYFAVYLILKSIDRAVKARELTIKSFEQQMQTLNDQNVSIGSSLELYSYFKTHYPDSYNEFMVRLSAFLREDEYVDDCFVQTSQETIEELYRLKRELKESGRVELNRLCQPTLQFSMSMANIYALPEFRPIVDQFQLGNVIKVGIRDGYIKQSRLLQVNIGLDDFSDFSCEFGDLTSPQTQSDLHADLLAQAISAGKQVASSAAYWNKGTDQANSIDLRIQRGLIDAATSIKSMDADQGVEIDNRGLHLRKVDQTTGAYDPEQGWITNNKFLYSNDGFKTVQSVFGKYNIDGEEYWGLLANAVVAGYIEGSKMRGGTIQIGDLGDNKWSFEVDNNGNVSMLGGAVQFNSTTNSLGDAVDALNQTIDSNTSTLQSQIDGINSAKMYKVEIVSDGPSIFSTKEDKATMKCIVYSWDTDITETLDASIFNWKRVSDDAWLDEIWNAMPEHQGVKSIAIDADDVVANSSFTCEVNLPE